MQFLCSIWKILHLPEYFYTGTAHGALNNYQVCSGSMIARSVPEIHCTRGDPDFLDEHEEELGILVVGLSDNE